MAKVNTNDVSFQFAKETTIGVLPGSPVWRVLEPNDITSFGATIEKVSRRPISPTRGRKKGIVVDKDSSPEWVEDLTVDAFTNIADGVLFAEFANKEFDLRLAGAPPTVDGTNDEFDIDAASTLLAGKVQWSAAGVKTLLWAKGYANPANNGLHVLDADLAATNVVIGVTSNLVDEASPPDNASLQVAGFRTDDLTLTISGSTATLVSAGDITNWSSLGVFPGMLIHIGSPDTTGDVQNAYSSNAVYGFARAVSINGSTLNLDKLGPALTGGPFGPATVDIMYGRFLRNVPTTADSDDNRYLRQHYQMEAGYPDLGGVGTDEYEYAIGNLANSMAIAKPLTDKMTITYGLVGTTTEPITPTRKTNAANAVSPLRDKPFNTSSSIASLTTDLVSAVSDVCFDTLTLTLLNNVTPLKCLGSLGARDLNVGLFQVDLAGDMLFTRKEIVNAIQNNQTVTFQEILVNEDGAIAVDIPAMTFGDGSRSFPLDESVKVTITGEAHDDPEADVPNVSVGITVFPIVPTVPYQPA